ncbi:MAG TPA: sigma-70 family RNA polymerase sigma factor [Candidatus Saccharimonadales bacterium]|nr:sigma-70 family RNA polymerase sigma factor [Candidatus Saccharimonadales bacterium]
MSIDPATLSDEALARQAQGGALESFEELVRRYETRLYRFLARACRNDADGADLTQETFMTAYTKLERYNPAQSFATWLFTIARRKCIDHWRARRPVEDEAPAERLEENSPAELAIRRSDQLDLWQRARAVLSDVQFQALWLKYVEDLSVAEMATVLGRTKTHVKVILFRARTALAEALDVQPGKQVAKRATLGPTANPLNIINPGPSR